MLQCSQVRRGKEKDTGQRCFIQNMLLKFYFISTLLQYLRTCLHCSRLGKCRRAASKVMPPVLPCGPMTSEADVAGMAAEVEPSHQYPIKFCCLTTRHLARECV